MNVASRRPKKNLSSLHPSLARGGRKHATQDIGGAGARAPALEIVGRFGKGRRKKEGAAAAAEVSWVAVGGSAALKIGSTNTHARTAQV